MIIIYNNTNKMPIIENMKMLGGLIHLQCPAEPARDVSVTTWREDLRVIVA